MNSHDKIKDVLLFHQNKDRYGLTVDNILQILQIARSTYYAWIRDYYLTGDDNFLSERVANIIRSSRKLTKECELFIINYVLKNPSFDMKKMVKKISNKYNISLSKGYIYTILKENYITNKKVQKVTYPYSKIKFKKESTILKKAIDNIENNYTCVDESTVYLGTSCNYGWSKKGTKCSVKSTFNRSNKRSLCTAISNEGIVAYKMIKGSFNTVKFNDFIINDVVPSMKNRAIMMDNCVIHKSKILRENLEESNIKLIFNVPYSPQFSPIELHFNTLKNNIKKNNTTTEKELNNILTKHIKSANKTGFSKYYTHTYDILNHTVNKKYQHVCDNII